MLKREVDVTLGAFMDTVKASLCCILFIMICLGSSYISQSLLWCHLYLSV